MLEIFPDRQLCITLNGKVVASALSLIIQCVRFGDNHTDHQILGNHTFDTHNPEGAVLYGINVFVHPEHRDMRLYEGRMELCENLNLRAIMAAGLLLSIGWVKHMPNRKT